MLVFFNICFTASLVHKNALLRLVSITSSYSSALISWIFFDSPRIPALLTNTSSLPNFWIAWSINAIQACSCEISPARKDILSLSFSSSADASLKISSAAEFSSCSSLEFNTRLYPVLKNSVAMALPIPRLEPVITATDFCYCPCYLQQSMLILSI